MPETVAVTGGNGRVGGAVLEHFGSEGYRTGNLSRGKPDESHSDGYLTTDSLEAAGELGVETVTLASSFSAIGEGFEPDPITVDYLPVGESHRLTPSTSYGLGKQTLETIADGFARRADDRPRTVTSLRFPWVVADLFPDAEVRAALADYIALVDTSKAERLFDWTPSWRWQSLD